MEKYRYPDKDDNITCLFINSNSDEKYWADSEENILNIITQRILKLDTKPNFLDLGCGFGRLFSTFYPYVNSITALEPDYERFLKAKDEANRIDSNKIQVINNDVSCINDKKFEAVLMSHIIQHIPFETTNNIVKKLSDIIPSGGFLFMTTTYTDTQDDVFTLEYKKDGKYFSEIVSKENYDKRFYDEGILPVRYFSYSTIDSLFSQNNFSIENIFVYHFDLSLTNNTPSVEFDQKRNEEKLYKGAKDVLYILKKL